MDLPPSPYRALDIPPSAPLPAIKSAYRKLVLQCHPDKVPDEAHKPAAADRFHLIQSSYEILADPARRARYDAQLKLHNLRADARRADADVPAPDRARRDHRPSPPDYFSRDISPSPPPRHPSHTSRREKSNPTDRHVRSQRDRTSSARAPSPSSSNSDEDPRRPPAQPPRRSYPPSYPPSYLLARDYIDRSRRDRDPDAPDLRREGPDLRREPDRRNPEPPPRRPSLPDRTRRLSPRRPSPRRPSPRRPSLPDRPSSDRRDRPKSDRAKPSLFRKPSKPAKPSSSSRRRDRDPDSDPVPDIPPFRAVPPMRRTATVPHPPPAPWERVGDPRADPRAREPDLRPKPADLRPEPPRRNAYSYHPADPPRVTIYRVADSAAPYVVQPVVPDARPAKAGKADKPGSRPAPVSRAATSSATYRVVAPDAKLAAPDPPPRVYKVAPERVVYAPGGVAYVRPRPGPGPVQREGGGKERGFERGWERERGGAGRREGVQVG